MLAAAAAGAVHSDSEPGVAARTFEFDEQGHEIGSILPAVTMDMKPILEEITAACVEWASREWGAPMDSALAREQVAGWLFGERALWDACEMGLVTNAELASGIADRFSTWVGHSLGRLLLSADGERDTLAEGLEAIVARLRKTRADSAAAPARRADRSGG